jgi:hypothetical protein
MSKFVNGGFYKTNCGLHKEHVVGFTCIGESKFQVISCTMNHACIHWLKGCQGREWTETDLNRLEQDTERVGG